MKSEKMEIEGMRNATNASGNSRFSQTVGIDRRLNGKRPADKSRTYEDGTGGEQTPQDRTNKV
jgi:hypothetical protein